MKNIYFVKVGDLTYGMFKKLKDAEDFGKQHKEFILIKQVYKSEYEVKSTQLTKFENGKKKEIKNFEKSWLGDVTCASHIIL